MISAETLEDVRRVSEADDARREREAKLPALLENAKLLVALLSDPHPGMWVWQDAVRRTREAIAP